MTMAPATAADATGHFGVAEALTTWSFTSPHACISE